MSDAAESSLGYGDMANRTLMVAEVLQWLRLHGRVQVASKERPRGKGTMVRRHFRRDAN